ncbi:MAG: DUF4838 domain-containing protein [Clostridia bacterium]|nr:DUF4838 domain-containing protein [Clostridia bacterium]
MICLLLVAALFVFPLVSCTQTSPEKQPKISLVLAEEGASDYRVILSAEADEELIEIAQEFVDYFTSITGVTLPIERDSSPEGAHEILIGKTNRTADRFDYESNKSDTFCYQSVDRSILLTGVGTRGVAYAVYAFLEEVCGVRYWTPDYESVPEQSTLCVEGPFDVTSSPLFSMRDLNSAGSSDPKWMVKMRLNGRQSLGSKNFHKTPAFGGGYGYAGWWVHTIASLAEMEEGENGFWDIQPCLMDEGVYQTVLKNVRKWLQENPDASLVSISQNDGDKNSMCQCEKCRAFVAEHGGAESALWIDFVSRIAEELGDEYPHVQFDTLSYTFTRKAPTGLTVPNNVVVRIAPLRSCYRHGLMSCTQKDPQAEELKESLAAWGELLTDNFHVWEYDAFFNEYWSPNVNYSRLRENLKLCADLGVSGMFIQGDSGANNGFSELRAYLNAKLLWDPTMDDETFSALMKDFCEGYYGTGTAEPLMRYIELVDEKTKDAHYTIYAHTADEYLPVDVTESASGTKMLDMSFLLELRACFDEAEKQVKDEEQLLHLKKARLQIQYYELLCYHYMEETFDSKYYIAARNDLGDRLYANAKEVGIRELREGLPLSQTTTETWRHPLMWNKEFWW